MSEARQKAQQAYDKAYDALEAIIDDPDATDAQAQAAQKAFDIALVALNHAIDESIQARTQALSKLVTALESVIATIQTNPLGNALDQLNNTVLAVNEAIKTNTQASGST